MRRARPRRASTWAGTAFGRIRRRYIVLAALLAGLGTLIAYELPLLPSQLRATLFWGLYAIPSNSVVPLPHEPGLLYFAPLAPAWALALAGSLGVLAVAYVDQKLIGWALGRPRAQRMVDSRVWQWTSSWLMRQPFLTLTTVAFVGFPPIQAVRVLAISSNYSVHRYAAATALGRFPRFWLLATLGHAVDLPRWLTLGIALVFIAWTGFLLLGPKARTHLPSGSKDNHP